MKKMFICILLVLFSASMVFASGQNQYGEPYNEQEMLNKYRAVFIQTGNHLIDKIYDMCDPNDTKATCLTKTAVYVNNQSYPDGWTKHLTKNFSRYVVDIVYVCWEDNRVDKGTCLKLFDASSSKYQAKMVNGSIKFVK